MTALSASLPPCPVPACKNATDQPGKPCSDCLAAFGAAIHEVPERTIDPEEFLRQQREGDEAVRSILSTRAFASMTPYERRVAGEIRKSNQLCWLCDRRRACVITEQGWECDTCRSTT